MPIYRVQICQARQTLLTIIMADRQAAVVTGTIDHHNLRSTPYLVSLTK